MNGKVLIVDDSLTVRMDLSEALEAAGYRPLLCSNLGDARDALAGQSVDLIILDVLLPDGDGVDLLKEIRAAPATREVPILMLSSEADVQDRIRGMQTGADDYVGKPYDAGYVVARAQELLRRRHSADQTPVAEEKPAILVIDDSATFREELRGALEPLGYGVITAATGEEGLRLAAMRRPAALIVDGVMPGIDGATVIRRLRLDGVLRGLPCLLLTASDEQGAELRALDAGADAFVRKEEDLGVILARFTAMLRTARTEPQASTHSSPKRILAVDDSLTYLQELGFELRDEGYDVVLARSGEEALDVVAVQNVDCILLDLLMPGIGGQETCRRIKASPALRNIPLIMLTAVEDRQALIEGLGTGADDYIAKSSEFDVVRARVQAQIRRKQFEDENRRIRERLLHSELEAAEARAARELAEAKAELVDELKSKNEELEAFSYSVSHDLRAPLRGVDGFSQALLEDYSDRLDETGQNYLRRIRAGAQRMAALIDDMLLLSRVNRAQIDRERVDVSGLAQTVAEELGRQNPDREVAVLIQPELITHADRGMMRILLENLLGNAWKFTARAADARIEIRADTSGTETVFLVKDNGAGFDMAHAGALFQPFQRLHSEADFPGTGIGLATVRRIVDRHGGRIWAEGTVDRGATVFFTVPISRARG
jgi:two-component system NtrC family sensor kinase